jgi:GH24 family phage-related lysozyme (muramidase)
MSLNTKEPKLMPKQIDLPKLHQPPSKKSDTPTRQVAEISLLARQIKQLKQNRKARQARRRTSQPMKDKLWDVRNGSFIRTIVLVIIALAGMVYWKLNPPTSNIIQSLPSQGLRQSATVDRQKKLSANFPTIQRVGQLDLDFIKNLEGFHATPYDDGPQQSWGYGTKAGPGTITRAQAEAEMKAYLREYCLPILPVGLPIHKATALASFCYNLGPDQAQQTSLWQAAHNGDEVNFLNYTRSAEGISLLPRRRQEQALWEGR